MTARERRKVRRSLIVRVLRYLASLGTPYAIESVEHEPGGPVTVAARVRL